MVTRCTMPPTACYGAFALRICLGIIYLGHSVIIKFVMIGLPSAMEWFVSMGYPAGLLYVVLVVEFLAGLALVLGVYTRVAALSVIPVLIGATWSHMGAGTALRGGELSWEFTALLIVLSMVQFLLGEGAFALRPHRPRSGSTG